MSTPIPATQYLNAIAAQPNLTPLAGAIDNDPVTTIYRGYANQEEFNAQFTNTGAYKNYVGGSDADNLGASNFTYETLLQGLYDTFPSLEYGKLDGYFNSLTTANPNAVQYNTAGYGTSSSVVEGSSYTPSSLTNTALSGATTSTPTLPSSFSGLLDSIVAYFGAKNPPVVLPKVTDPRNTPAYKAFLAVFETYQQTSGLLYPVISPFSSQNLLNGPVDASQNADWSIVPGYQDPNLNLAPSGSVSTQFENAFAAFLKNFPSKQLENLASDGTYNLISPRSFFTTWENFITSTSSIQSATKNNAITYIDPATGETKVLASSADANQYLLNYQSIYQAFFPTDTEADFQKFFQAFYQKIMADPANGGYFLPSHFVSQFFEDVKHKYIRPLMGQGADMNMTKPVLSVIWEVLARIQEMVGIIQQLSVFVSQRLTFLTNYQKAYTNLIATIPQIASGDTILGDANVETRNNQLGNYRQTLTSYRDQLTAQSKGVQSYLDTLSQASSNSLNQGGALLTMLNGLLSIIRAP